MNPITKPGDLTDEQIDSIDLRRFSGPHALRDYARAVLALAALGTAPATPVPAGEPVARATQAGITSDLILVRVLARSAIQFGDLLYATPTSPAPAPATPAVDLLHAALRELLTTSMSQMPPAEAGQDAQNQWADRMAAARKAAAVALDATQAPNPGEAHER
jgi:hypothetical protein